MVSRNYLSIIHTSYYANYFLCHTNLKLNVMKLDKKILFRHISMLQCFRACYMTYQCHKYDGTRIFEVRKLWKDENGNMQKLTTFALSKEDLPLFVDISPIINYDVTLLDDNHINNYVSQCKSYGIL